MKIIHAVGARPNFMKAAPILEAFDRHNATHQSPAIEQLLVHTGQHYDRVMSDLFFDQLGLPRPHVDLGVGSGPHGQQTGRIMEAFEKVLQEERPDLLVVVGDVNSTLACTIDAKKMGVAVAHVEAGLRSGDMGMPEEINRILTDAIADLLLTTDRGAMENLRREGVAPERMFFVGNVMIDTLMKHKAAALSRSTLQDSGLDTAACDTGYVLATLHRPGNVDAADALTEIGSAFREIGKRMPVLFPVHPRTRAAIGRFGLEHLFGAEAGVRLLEPMGYLDFLNLQANARVVLTDSGGIQEETTILGVPCLTLRPNTERPITIHQGTNRLVGGARAAILEAFEEALTLPLASARSPELWDGRAAERVVEVIIDWFARTSKRS